MTKSNKNSQNQSQPATESISEKHIRNDVFDHALNREMPASGKNEVNTIMQRTATPPMPDSGDKSKK